MTQYPPHHPASPHVTAPQPSIIGPVAFTAWIATALFSLPSVLSQGVDMCFVQNCCSSVFGAGLGIFPILFYTRIGGQTSGGMGCLVGMLAVGTGALAGALVQALYPPYDPSELRQQLDEIYPEFKRAYEQGSATAEITREEFVAGGMATAPYLVLFTAFISSLGAGLVGLIAGAAARRRQPPGGYPGGQWPHQQQPPQAPQV